MLYKCRGYKPNTIAVCHSALTKRVDSEQYANTALKEVLMKYYGVLLITILVLLSGCEVKQPSKPKWDIDLAVPLINQMYFVSDLVDSVNIVTDNNDVLTLTSNGNVSTETFGDIAFNPPADAGITDAGIPSAITIEETIPFADPTGHVLFAYASIAQGVIQTKFTNVHPSAVIELEFGNIFTADNEKLRILASPSADWVNHSLVGCHIGTRNSNSIVDELQIKITSTSNQPLGTPIATMGLLMNSPMAFDEIQGKLYNFTMGLQESMASIDIEYPQGLNEAITLHEASIIMELQNDLGFEAEFSGQFYASNDNGEEASIPILTDNGQNFQVVPGANTLEVHNAISSLLTIMPTHIEIRNGMFTIMSGNELGSVRSTDKIDLAYTVKAPFTFTLHAQDIVVKDEVSIAIARDNAERIEKNAKSAKLVLNILNKLPVGATATAYFSRTPDIDVADNTTYNYTKSAVIHPSNTPEGSSDQILELNLNTQEIKLFSNPKVYLKWKFSFMESGSQVTIHATSADYLRIKSMLYAKILVEY